MISPQAVLNYLLIDKFGQSNINIIVFILALYKKKSIYNVLDDTSKHLYLLCIAC